MRRLGRQSALQILFQMDLAGTPFTRDAAAQAITDYRTSFDPGTPENHEFTERLVYGVVDDLPALDEAITGASQNWRLDRMGKVERNLLRLAAFELLRCPDVPRGVAINEALELGRRYAGNEVVPFLNGILDQLKPTTV